MKTLLFSVLLVLWPSAAHAQALLAGAEYYDSFQTLAEILIIDLAGNQDGREFLQRQGRILPKATDSLPIIIIARGREPDSGAEFRFPEFPRTYWTFSKNIATIDELKANPTPTPTSPAGAPVTQVPMPTPSPTPAPVSQAPTPTATPSPSSTPKPKAKHESGAIEWHRVDGQWKWRPLDRSQFKGWQAGARAPDGSRGP